MRANADLGESAEPMLALLEELEKRNVTLEDTNRELEQFAEVAAHDLRAPLTLVRGYLEQTLRHDRTLSDSTREWLTLALDATIRMAALVQALLAHSATRATALEPAVVPLREVFEDARVCLLPPGAPQPSISIGALPDVLGDRQLLTTVAQNLLDNALKFTRPGVPPKIEVTARLVPSRSQGLTRDTCVVQVRDNGIGIKAEDRQRVLARYGRSADVSAVAGHGIGLATCASIIRRHHGVLRIVDVDGPGAAVELELPAAPGNSR